VYLPTETKERDIRARELIDQCMLSREDRCRLYEKRRRWFLWGNDSTLPVRYNRLMSHTDLVQSFLYSADHLGFSISHTSGDDKSQKALAEPASDYLSGIVRDSALVHQYGLGVLWSLVYCSMFLKMGWNDSRKMLFGKLIDPHCFGVYDEAEADLSSQEAFCHSYMLGWDNAYQRMLRAGRKGDIPRLVASDDAREERYPTSITNLIISATGGADMSAPVIGQVRSDYQSRETYQPVTSERMVRFWELWVWDDKAEDYVMLVVADPDIVVTDSRESVEQLAKHVNGAKPKWASATNLFLPKRHPFVHIQPYPLYDFFFGEAHSERLIPLQEWTNTRLDQISDLLARQVDPAKVLTGFNGLTDEKINNLGGPGSWVYDDSPNGKVDELKPEIPAELFIEFNEIGQLFNEASGLTETLTGKGAEGVRSAGQAKKLVTTGSGRIKKTAVGLERSLGLMGELALELLMRNDDTVLTGEDGRQFLLDQMAGNYSVRVAGHSQSPLFQDDTKEVAAALFKASAIDKESLLKIMNPPNVEALIHKLKEREAREAQMNAMGIVPPGTKEQQERTRSHHSPRGDLK